MDDPEPGLEKRSRIQFLVPVPVDAVDLEFLNEIFTELNRRFKGVTYSRTAPPAAFHGFWITPGGVIEPDNNVLVTIDAILTEADQEFGEMVEYLADLKRRLQERLEQTLIWMTIHPVNRVVAFDPALPQNPS